MMGKLYFCSTTQSKAYSQVSFLTAPPVTYPDELTLSISHATDINKDRDAILKHQEGNRYTASVDLDPLESKYYVQVSNEGQLNWRMREVGKLPKNHIEFIPLSSFDEPTTNAPADTQPTAATQPASETSQ